MSSIIVEYLHILRTVPSAVAILYQVTLVYVRVVAGWFLLPPPDLHWDRPYAGGVT